MNNMVPILPTCTCGYGQHVICSDSGPTTLEKCPLHGHIGAQAAPPLSRWQRVLWFIGLHFRMRWLAKHLR
jgi:hypothetical protein